MEHLRAELSILSELERGISVKEKIFKLKRKFRLDEENITTVKETVKQKMQFKVQRLQKYEKRGKFYRQNFILKNDATTIYREIGKEKVTVNDVAINDIERFWDTIWSDEKDFSDNAEHIQHTRANMK